MFDPITPARLVAMLGELLRDSARWERPLDEFRSSQLLSASSVARYLSAEMEGAGVHLAWFAAEADELAASAQATAREPEWRQALVRARSQLAPAPSTVADPSVHARGMGAAGTEVLRAARSTSDPGAARFAASFRRLLAELADRHVALLGAPAESR